MSEPTIAASELEIRPAAPAELAAVGDMCVAAYAEFLAAADSDYVESLRDANGRAAAAEVLVAAVPGGPVLGTITFVPDGGPLSEIAAPGEAEFRMLAVAAAAQGKGVGTALLEHVIEAGRRRGSRAIVCSSQPNMHAAHRIYERVGLSRAPERDWSPLPGVDLIVFERVL